MTNIGDVNQFKITSLNDVPKLSQYRPNRQFSFRTGGASGGRPLLDPCLDLSLEQVQDFISTKGRNWFEIVTYAADQVKNFPSQYSRYERGSQLRPDRLDERGGKPVYLFCQRGSTDFWEVSEEGITYLKLSKNTFVIICPVPWTLSSLGEYLDTDGVDGDVLWTQEQGRDTSITPDDAIDPIFYTYGLRDVLDPPILIRVEAKDDADLFDYLAIDPIARSLHGSGSYAPTAEFDIDPTKRITKFYLVPGNVESAYVWTGQTQRAAYLPPVETDNFLKAEGRWQEAEGGIGSFELLPYQSFEVVNNRWYTPISIYTFPEVNEPLRVIGEAFSLSYPPLCHLPSAICLHLFADNLGNSIAAIALSDFQFTFFPPSLITQTRTSNCGVMSAIASAGFEFAILTPAVNFINSADNNQGGSFVNAIAFEFTVYASEGVIIG